VKKARMLRELLNGSDINIAPMAHNALTAKLIEEAGFKLMYTSGNSITNTLLGYPDVGLMTLTENLNVVNYMVDVTTIPIVADIDTGYGNALNLYRTVKDFEKAGVAGIQVEDQVTPKRCGHYIGKQIISTKEMVNKIHAATDARRSDELVIFARTDALAVEGVEAAIERAQIYHEAGADGIFVETPSSRNDFELIGKALKGIPQLTNMAEGTRIPPISLEELKQMGFKVVGFSDLIIRTVIKNVQEVLSRISNDGDYKNCISLIAPWKERTRLTGFDYYRKMEEKYLDID